MGADWINQGRAADLHPNGYDHAPASRAKHGGPSKGDLVGGRYQLAREIARGGMGVVYEARQRFTGRSVALKFVPTDAPQLELGRERLVREARVLGSLRHGAVVEIYDAGICPDVGPYLALEMLEGRTLDGILAARRTLGVRETLWVASRIGEALAHAHRRGVMHRDVKPANIFVSQSPLGESVKLLDFGIAGEIAAHHAVPSAKLTRSGDVLGTLEYMAPEQLANAEVTDPRSDQHALAVVLLECLTGTVPPLAERMSRSRVVDLSPLGVPAFVSQALYRALAPSPSDRYENMGTFLRALLGDRPAEPTPLLTRAATEAEKLQAQAPTRAEPSRNQPAASRRRYARAAYITPVRVHRDDGTYVDGRTEDISEGGMLVILPQQLKHTGLEAAAALSASGARESVRARFALPTTGVAVNVAGTVRWIRDARGRAALGIEFDAPAEEVRRSIATYVEFVGAGQPPS